MVTWLHPVRRLYNPPKANSYVARYANIGSTILLTGQSALLCGVPKHKDKRPQESILCDTRKITEDNVVLNNLLNVTSVN